jgi:glutathione S-transferase
MVAFGVENHGKVKLFGAAYSVYVRAVRLTLEEKGVPYERVEIDVFAAGGPPADYLARQPFGRIPAFEHEGFRLYEAGAIERYIDEVFDGPLLQPCEPKARARMNQAIGILDSYVYRTLVWDIYVERVVRARRKGPRRNADCSRNAARRNLSPGAREHHATGNLARRRRIHVG